jgi:hypothetical protein
VLSLLIGIHPAQLAAFADCRNRGAAKLRAGDFVCGMPWRIPVSARRTKVKELTSDERATTGLPRRAAMQGMAGSLAGIAALGAVGAAAKKKNKKKSKKGTLARVEIAEVIGPALGSTVSPVEAICDAPGNKEDVFVLGGGFRLDPDRLSDLILVSSSPTTAGGEQGWAVEAENLDTEAIDITAFAVCGYFRKK